MIVEILGTRGDVFNRLPEFHRARYVCGKRNDARRVSVDPLQPHRRTDVHKPRSSPRYREMPKTSPDQEEGRCARKEARSELGDDHTAPRKSAQSIPLLNTKRMPKTPKIPPTNPLCCRRTDRKTRHEPVGPLYAPDALPATLRTKGAISRFLSRTSTLVRIGTSRRDHAHPSLNQDLYRFRPDAAP